MQASASAVCWRDSDQDPALSFSPVDVVARFVIRRAYRAARLLAPVQRVVLLIGGYPPKLIALKDIFHRYGVQVVSLSPRWALKGADVVADLLDAQGFAMMYVLPLVDCAVATSDVLNGRLGQQGNDPATSDLRRDKFAQQEALRRSGLPAAAQYLVTEAEAAAKCAAERFGLACQVPATSSAGSGLDETDGAAFSLLQSIAVVVKPKDAAGGDGIWLCMNEAQVRAAVTEELGRQNIECTVNSELVLMEVLVGEEWVVNSVSHDGIHKMTDIWHGPPKFRQSEERGAAAQFLYTEQFLAPEGPQRRAVLSFCCAVLDAVGMRNGAAHSEFVWTEDGLRLLEVNARPAGGLPRMPGSPNQLEALVMSLLQSECFAALPAAPEDDGLGAAVVFLRAPLDGWLQSSALMAMMSLGTFKRFDRDLLGLRGDVEIASVPVRRTVGLFSSPGTLVLQGNAAHVKADVMEIRRIEETAYTVEPCDDRACVARSGGGGTADSLVV